MTCGLLLFLFDVHSWNKIIDSLLQIRSLGILDSLSCRENDGVSCKIGFTVGTPNILQMVKFEVKFRVKDTLFCVCK